MKGRHRSPGGVAVVVVPEGDGERGDDDEDAQQADEEPRPDKVGELA